MKVNQLKIGSLLSYLQMALNILINLFYTPIMIHSLGKSEYGLYQTVTSTIAMLSILSLGFNASYIRFFARYKKNDDRKSIEKLNGLFLIVFTIIGIIALACGMFLTLNLELVFSTGLTASEYEIAEVLMLLSTINLALMFPMSVFQNIISANERFVVLKLLGMLKTVFSPLVGIPLLLMGFRSVVLVLITLIISIITDCIYIYYVVYVLKNRFVFHDFEKGIFKNLFVYTAFIAINMIVDQINLNVGKILLGRYRGTADAAVYSVGFTLYHMYQSFSTSVSSVFTPRIHKIVNDTKENLKKQRGQLTELFVKVGRVQFLVLGLVSTGIVFFGRSFILDFWAGKGYEDSYGVAVLFILPATIALIQNVGIEIQRALNKHQFRSVVYLIMAFVNLVVSIILCQRYGAIGCAIGTAISFVLANGFIMNIYYHKQCSIDIIYFWKNILRMGVGLLIPIVVGIVMNRYVDTSQISAFILSVGVYTIVYILSMWMMAMNTYEKDLVRKVFRKLRRK